QPLTVSSQPSSPLQHHGRLVATKQLLEINEPISKSKYEASKSSPSSEEASACAITGRIAPPSSEQPPPARRQQQPQQPQQSQHQQQPLTVSSQPSPPLQHHASLVATKQLLEINEPISKGKYEASKSS